MTRFKRREPHFTTPIKIYLCFAVILLIALQLSLTITQFQAQIVKGVKDPPPIINRPQIVHPVILKNVGQSYGIHLIGERHSGTNWITDHLKACFGHAVPVIPRLTEFKHWFQYPSLHNIEDYGVVISLVRNPYDWILAMMENPHHSLAHWNLTSGSPLPWKDFVTKRWTLDRQEYAFYLSGEDLDLIEKVNNGLMSHDELLNVPCDGSWKWRHVVPCSKSDRNVSLDHAIYEMNYDESGQPYNSIVELRRDKILNFFQAVPNMPGVNHFIPLRYEDVISQGSFSLIERVENALGIKAICDPLKPQNFTRKKRSHSFVQWMDENFNWKVEAIVGYGKENSADDILTANIS